MTSKERLRVTPGLIGLALVAACVARQPGDGLDESETGDGPGDGDTAGDGDGDGDDGSDGVAFELVSASFGATGQLVTLHFSEPVAPVTGVDPADFRVSYAAYTALCGDNGCVDQTSYWDPNFYANDYLGYAPGSNERFEVDLVSPGDDAADIVLHFGAALNPGLCEYIAPYEGTYAFLYVHYSPGDIPVESADGESLPAIGPEWVEHSFHVMDVDGEFPNLDPRVPIPCP